LGVIFDSKLNFVPYITMLKEKCMKPLDVILKSGGKHEMGS
jgi:hypothetical protein